MIYSGKAITVQATDGGIAELCFDLQDDSVNKFNALTITNSRKRQRQSRPTNHSKA